MYQQLILVGNLGNDPEMRYTPSGVQVTTFRLAVNKRWTDSDGQSQEKTTWFNLTAWRRLAEVANQYLHKGSKVMIVGEVEEARPWVDKEGNQQASIEVTIREFKMLDGRSANGTNGSEAVATEEVDIPL